VKPWQEEKRYMQCLVLYALSGVDALLKGGTYLWLFHALNRYSEDLDFTVIGEVGADLPQRVAETLGLFGAATQAGVVKDDPYTFSFTLHVRGPLYDSAKSVCHVRVDMSRREKPLLPHTPVTLNEAKYGIPPVGLQGMRLEEVLAEKVRAILRRNAVRDVYDAWFLIERLGVEVDTELVNTKLAFYNSTFSPTQLIKRVEAHRDHWEPELTPLIFGEPPSFNQVAHTFERSFSQKPSRGASL
jgi:predicted nucleotidyltransferase component of viral defense system